MLIELLSIDGSQFEMLRPLSYQDPRHTEPFTVPADLMSFRTDLASVPLVFTWLVPRSGIFLPAAILHDGLVKPGEYLGPNIDRPEADRIFREAMIHLGTGKIRAWLMWAAVTMGTMWNLPTKHWYWRGVLIGHIAAVAMIGIAVTIDLIVGWDLIPWVAADSVGVDLVGGAIAALVIPTLFALSWRQFRLAGIIVGVALAFLLHVTILIALIYGGYWVAERCVSGRTT